MNAFVAYLNNTKISLSVLIVMTLISSLLIIGHGEINLDGIKLTPQNPVRFIALHLGANLLFYFILEGFFRLSLLTGRFGILFLTIYATFVSFTVYSIIDVAIYLNSDDWKLYTGMIVQMSIWVIICYIQGKKLFDHLRPIFHIRNE